MPGQRRGHRRARLRPVRRAGALALAVAAATAAASLGATESEAAVGDLTLGSCVANTAVTGVCADLPGSMLAFPASVAVRSDSGSAYVTATNGDSVSHLLAPGIGDLGFSGCDSRNGSGGLCTDLTDAALQFPTPIALSPDGSSAYVGTSGTSLAHFNLVGTGGVMMFEDCVDAVPAGDCADIPTGVLIGSSAIAVGPDRSTVYAASGVSDSVVQFSADPSGSLAFASCASQTGTGGLCENVPGSTFDLARDIAVSPDGSSVFVAAQGESTSTSSLTRLKFVGDALLFGECTSWDGSGGSCADVPGTIMKEPRAVAVSPDGRSLYVVDGSSNALIRFAVASNGVLTFDGCASRTGSGGVCTTVDTLDGPLSLAVSGDGRSIYVAAFDSVVQFGVPATGAPSFERCYSVEGSAGRCVDVVGALLDGVTDVAVSPAGGSVYVTAVENDDVVRFVRERVPGAAPDDRTSPTLKLAGGKGPSGTGRAGRPIEVTVSCDEPCSVEATGSAKPKGGRSGKLRGASAELEAGASAELQLRPKGRLKRKLKKAGKGRAALVAVATDGAGNTAQATASVRLK